MVSRTGSSVQQSLILTPGTSAVPHSGNYILWSQQQLHVHRPNFPQLVSIFLDTENFAYAPTERPSQHEALLNVQRELFNIKVPLKPEVIIEQSGDGSESKREEPNEQELKAFEMRMGIYDLAYEAYQQRKYLLERTLDVEEKIYIDLVKSHNLMEHRLNTVEKPKLYAAVRQLISNGSIDLCKKSNPAFETEIDNVCDLPKLLRLLRTTHSIAITRDIISDNAVIYKMYDEVRQSQNENHYAYHQRYTRIKEQYVAAGGAVREGKYEAMKYLLSLYKREHNQKYMVDISNEVRLRQNPDLWPQSVQEAYDAITSYSTLQSNGQPQTVESIFLAEQKEKQRKRDEKRKKKPGDEEKAVAKPDVKSNTSAGGGGRPKSPSPRPDLKPGGEDKSGIRACRFCEATKGQIVHHDEKACPVVLELYKQRREREGHTDTGLMALSTTGDDNLPQDFTPLDGSSMVHSLSSILSQGICSFLGTAKIQEFEPKLMKAIGNGIEFSPTELILDNGCNVGGRPGIINSAVICNRIYSLNNSATVVGLGAKTFTQQCDVNYFGDGFYYSSSAPANILSFKHYTMNHDLTYSRENDTFTLTLECGITAIFCEHVKTGLYVCDVTDILNINQRKHTKHVTFASNLVDTVDERLSKLSKREKQQVARVKQFIESTGFHSDRDIVTAIQSGAIKNIDITEHDLARYRQIYPKDVAALKGKSTQHKSKPVQFEDPKPIPASIKTLQVLVIDMFFVNGIIFLLSKSLQLRYVITAYISSKSQAVVWKAIKQMVGVYKMRGLGISHILTDREPAVLALKTNLEEMGITLEPTSGNSVEEAEREIRTIKERARAVRFTCPYNLCTTLLVYLILFCTNSLNNFSRDPANVLSPNALLSGFQPDFKKIGAFGKYVQVPNRDVTDTNRNSINIDRTKGGITALFPHTREPTCKVFMLDTKRVISYPIHELTYLPMPAEVQAHLNAIAAKEAKTKSHMSAQGKTLEQNLSFTYRDLAISDDEDTEEDDFDIEEVVPLGEYRSATEPNDLDDANDMQISKSSEEFTQPLKVVTGATEVPEIDGVSPARVLFQDEDTLDMHEASQVNDEFKSGGESSTAFLPEEIMLEEHIKASLPVEPSIQQPEVPQPAIPDVESSAAAPESPRKASPVKKASARRMKAAEYDKVYTEHYIGDTSQQRSTRSGKTYGIDTANLNLFMASILDFVPAEIPTDIALMNLTPAKALRKHKTAALDSIVGEISQLGIKKKVFKPTDLKKLSKEQVNKVIRSSMFLREKFKPDGQFEKLKSRLVGGGHMQDRSLYTDDDTSSPTVSVTAILAVAAIAASEQRKVATIDIPGAYLNADLEPGKEILMRLNALEASILVNLDPSFNIGVLANGDCIVQLNKALYGLVESALLWHKHITKTLCDLGFVQNPYDQCVYNLMRNGMACTVTLHVDDLFISSRDMDNLNYLYEGLKTVYGSLDIHHGPKINYVGMTMDFKSSGKVVITQDKFIQDILSDIEVKGQISSPADNTLFRIDESSPLLETARKELFHSVAAKLLYLAKRTRPDLLILTSYLTSRVQAPTEEDYDKLLRGLRYLKSTVDIPLSLSANIANLQPISILSYVDASFATHPDMRSHTGALITLGEGAIYAKSGKQILNTTSSTESELVGLSDSSVQVIWVRNFLTELGYPSGPAIVCQDNESTIRLAEKGRSTSARTRHINIRYFFIKDRIQNGELEIKQVPTSEMIADVLTKPLQGKHFRDLRDLLLNVGEKSINFLSFEPTNLFT